MINHVVLYLIRPPATPEVNTLYGIKCELDCTELSVSVGFTPGFV